MLLLSSSHRRDVENEMNEKIQWLMYFIEILNVSCGKPEFV
jgi:hypothetical protein